MKRTLALGAFALSLASLAGAQQVVKCSVTSSGSLSNGPSDVGAVDDSGQLVVFDSVAGNLTPNLPNGQRQVFLRNRALGTTTLVSYTTPGVGGAAFSYGASISADGTTVCFESSVSQFVPGDTNSSSDIFVRHLPTGQIVLASRSAAGALANASSSEAEISADGTKVVFQSWATNLVSGDANGSLDVFLKDLVTSAITRLSATSAGASANGPSSMATISTDGTCVAFESGASNLVPNDTNNNGDIFVRDLLTGVTSLESAALGGGPSNAYSFGPRLSANGRFVAFTSYATNLIAGGPNTVNARIYVRDRVTGVTSRVNYDHTGGDALGDCSAVGVSDDGRYVWFLSGAVLLVPGDQDNHTDLFVRDMTTGTNRKLTVGFDGGTAGEDTKFASISRNRSYVTFSSYANRLIPGDLDTLQDVYMLAAWGPSAELFVDLDGDGYGTNSSWTSGPPSTPGLVLAGGDCDDADPARHPGAAEPCDGIDNDCDSLVDDGCIAYYCTPSTTTHGCTPLVYAAGVASVTTSSPFYLSAYNVEGGRSGLFRYGLAPAGYIWAIGSTSWACVSAPSQRTLVVNAGGTLGTCDGQLLFELNAFLRANPAALGAPFAAGTKLYAQAWFRDPPAVTGVNLSNAVQIELGP